MHNNTRNIYQSARACAGLTQEQAAERLALSVESVRAYETGQRTPPPVTVAWMADVYGSPGLRLEYARETDELDLIPRDAEPRTFPLAVLALCSRLTDFETRRRRAQLLRIAEDGALDESERAIYETITRELERIGAAWLSLKCAQKNDRPEGGASKRSVPGRAENHGNAILSASTARVKPQIFAGGEVTLP